MICPCSDVDRCFCSPSPQADEQVAKRRSLAAKFRQRAMELTLLAAKAENGEEFEFTDSNGGPWVMRKNGTIERPWGDGLGVRY